jgi:hypothetical protein
MKSVGGTWYKSRNYNPKYALDQDIKGFDKTWFRSTNHCPKLDINQGIEISKLIVDLNQKITRKNLI